MWRQLQPECREHDMQGAGIPVSCHYGDVIMGAIASQIASLTIVFSTVYLDTDQRKHQSSMSLAFVWGIHRGPVNSPHKWPVTRKMFTFDEVIMIPSNRHSHAKLIWLITCTVERHSIWHCCKPWYSREQRRMVMALASILPTLSVVAM